MSGAALTAGWRTTTLATTAASLLAACGHSAPTDTSPTPFLTEESDDTFAEIDKNRDGRLNFDTFDRGLTVHYYFRQGLDLDGDGVAHPMELTTALYELWDVDGRGSLDDEEWHKGVDAWFPDRPQGMSFMDWDTNADAVVGMIEFGEATLRWPLFDAYDGNDDGTIETTELSRYLYGRWDENQDGYIDRSEWRLP